MAKIKRIGTDGKARVVKRNKKHPKEHYQKHYNRLCKLLNYEEFSCGVGGLGIGPINLAPNNQINPDDDSQELYGAQEDTLQNRLNVYNNTIKQLQKLPKRPSNDFKGIIIERSITCKSKSSDVQLKDKFD